MHIEMHIQRIYIQKMTIKFTQLVEKFELLRNFLFFFKFNGFCLFFYFLFSHAIHLIIV